MNDIKTALQGKKTHIVVAGLILLGAFMDFQAEGVDLETLRQSLQLALISTVKAAFDRWVAA